jgi:hypothetical protein
MNEGRPGCRSMSGTSYLRGYAEAKDAVLKNRIRYGRIGKLNRSACCWGEATFMQLDSRQLIIVVPNVVAFYLH